MQEPDGLRKGAAKSANNGTGWDPTHKHRDGPDSGAGAICHCLGRDGRVTEKAMKVDEQIRKLREEAAPFLLVSSSQWEER